MPRGLSVEWVVGRDDDQAVARAFFSSVVPRPIGLIATVDRAGRRNLAPYAFSAAVCHLPPVVAVAPGLRDGRLKDTAANVLDTGEFVYHLVSRDLLARAVQAGAALPPEVDEASALGMAVVPSVDVTPPRLAEARVALECRLWDTHALPDGRQLLLGRVLRIHAADHVVVDGMIDDASLEAVGRLGGSHFTASGDVFAMPFPAQI